MPLDPRLQVIADAQPGNDSEVLDLERRMKRQELAARNPFAANSLPPLRFVGVEVSWATSWGNYGNGYASVGYRRGADSYVDLEGVAAKSAAGVQGETIFQLPVDCRPTTKKVYATVVTANGISSLGDVVIWPDGTVSAFYATGMTGAGVVTSYALDGIRFRTA